MSNGPVLEIDCPRCGIDYDFDPVPAAGDVVTCPCGHVYTNEELAMANIGEWVGDEYRSLQNPWASLV